MDCRVIRILMLLALAGFILIAIPVSADTGNTENTLTRGGRFTITITGNPNTPYYFWLARTYSMSGNPGDQPPVVLANQRGVEQDSPDGPYTIGNYAYYNGNGRTILEDVAPSSPSMPNTSYYGKATTGADGRAVVAFTTSSATATRSFSVKTENPTSPGSSNALVEEAVYSRTTPPTIQTPRITAVPSIAPSLTPEPMPPVPSVQETLPAATTAPPAPSPTRSSSAASTLLSAMAAGILAYAAGKRK